MKDPRAGKRRRISDLPVVDEDGDTAMNEDDQYGHSEAVTPTATPAKATPTSRSNPRRSSNGGRDISGHDTAGGEEDGPNGADSQTTSRAGLRLSGRQRKPPQRYEEELGRSNSTRKTRSTQKPNGFTPKVVQRSRNMSEFDSNEGSPQPPTERFTRTRSKRASVRFNTVNDTANESSEVGAEDVVPQSPSPDDYQDGLDDLVSFQLQQDLAQNGPDGEDEHPMISEPTPSYVEQFQTLARDDLMNELRLLTRLVLEKLNGKRLIPLKGLENEHLKVSHLIEQTVTVGEGNSMLLLGSRGSGKSAIVENTISSLGRVHTRDFHVVRLNGFLHTDDRLALREIWHQLGRETNTEEEAGKVSSYADTMATLLALLSHPEELFGPSGDSETMTTAKSIIIILDEFDLFVTHPRQTLLYNLFDIAQAKKAPLAVLGLTTKVDVTEMLEKRVKSRFSHRSVFVPLPRTLEIFSDICLAGLNLDEDEALRLIKDLGPEEQSVIRSERWARLLKGWTAFLHGLWADAAFQSHLRSIYYRTKSVKEFFTSALIAVTDLHHSTYEPTSDDVFSLRIPTPATFTGNLLSCPDPAPLPFSTSTTASASPSSLPLSLLLAATRLTALYDPGLEAAQTRDLAPLALSFPAAYAEYVRLLTSAKTSASVSGATVTPGRVWGRDVAREAWEKLVSWGLISPVGGGSGTADGRMFRIEISFEEAVEMAGSGGSLGRWWRDA